MSARMWLRLKRLEVTERKDVVERFKEMRTVRLAVSVAVSFSFSWDCEAWLDIVPDSKYAGVVYASRPCGYTVL